MFSQYFGHYLLNRGLITREQLSDALEYQKSVHVKFGIIAMDEGFMTATQVEEVHEKQKQMDKRFGEIAVDLGILTEEQVEKLISSQKQGHQYLAQALVDRGYLTFDEFGKALNDYKKDFSLSDAQFEAIRSGNIDTIVEGILTSQDESLHDKYSKYLSLFVKNMIRFIDDQVYLEIATEHDVKTTNWFISQNITGEAPLKTGMSMNDEALLYLASVYAEEEILEVDALAKDSVCEFLNLHNGIYLVNMSNSGVELKMDPQQIDDNTVVHKDSLIVNVYISKGSFQLVIA